MQVDKAEQDKQSAIIKAQGEATSARLIGEAIQENPAFITLRKIEAARDIAGTISGAANKVFLSSDSLLLNLVSLVSLPNPDSSNRHFIWLQVSGSSYSRIQCNCTLLDLSAVRINQE
jgi:hypothetical protein